MAIMLLCGQVETSLACNCNYTYEVLDFIIKLQLSGCNDVRTTVQMQQQTVEAAALVFCLNLYNPEAQNAFVNSNEGPLPTEGPDPALYPMLLVGEHLHFLVGVSMRVVLRSQKSFDAL